MAAASSMTDEELAAAVRKLVPTVDLQTTGVKKFIKLLEADLNMDLSERKAFIKAALTQAINEMDDDEEEEEEEEEDSNDEEEEEELPKKRKKSGGGGGFGGEKEISAELAKFFKVEPGSKMARTAIVKELWVYIRENNLQNPADKREIILDKKMKRVFGCDTFTMFSMNKYVGAHVHPFKPVDLTSKSTTPSSTKKKKAQREEEEPTTTSGGRIRIKRKAAPVSRTTGSSATKKNKKTGTQPPYRLSEELIAVVGEAILPRPQVVSKLWEYIKANNLQNPADKRQIVCDAKLKAVMKKDKVTMFNMNSFIGRHMLEKVDRSEYQHVDTAPNNHDNGSGSDDEE